MTAPIDELKVFAQRCEAKAFLVAEGHIELRDAMDELQSAAEGYALPARIGQDAVQKLIVDAMDKAGCDFGSNPYWPMMNGAGVEELARENIGRSLLEPVCDWPALDKKLLGDDRAPAPALNFDALPQAWTEWVRQMAEDCGSSADYVASNLIGTASAVLGNVRRVRAGEGWTEQPHLWIANVGAPSSNKTPALRPFQAACSEIEQKHRPAFEEALVKYREGKELAAAEEAAWKAKIKDAVSEGKTPPKKPRAAEAPTPPKEPRVLVIDTTTERVQMLLVDNPRGLILVRSELAGFLGQLEKHGSSDADRGFYLESWDGGVYYVDRIKYEDGAKIVRHNSLAIVASVQPDKLEPVFSGPNDGLFTRFLYTFPEPVPPQPLQGDGNKERIAALRNAFDRLRSLPWAHDYDGREVPELLNVEDEGLQILQRMRQEIFRATKKGARGILATWRGKNPGRLLRLALVYEFLDWSYSGAGAVPTMVRAESVRRAELYLQYCEAMLERVLGDLAYTEAQRDAAILAQFIFDTKPARINERQIYQQRGFHHLRDADRRKSVFAELAAAGWIRKDEASGKRGRSASDWEVNSTIFRVVN
jgi:Protein of unknown function (DUF3987)